ncbi:TetR/AcrR family transcriptional regulator [Nocardia sp. R7R-8]|uniref:TetR/AcrR family transcriptional regulator n=1 Tax=Nocardia sp. R7R-8 TaxID=3459304 RepID=UPI00403E286B
MATVNRQDYFDAALEMLAKSGYGNLRLTSLCKSLGVTSGSFYNWFKDWNDFVAQFLEYWTAEQTENVADEATSLVDPLARLDHMRKLARETPHAAEVAMRAWSSTDQRVADVQDHVDQLRLALIEQTMTDLNISQPLAHRLAQLALSIVIGHQHLDPAELDWSLAQFIALVRLHAGAEGNP